MPDAHADIRPPTLLADVVATSAAVAATRSRRAKVAALAALLARLRPEEVAPAVGFLAGEVRQGRVGVGWSTLARVDVAPAEQATLEVGDLDRLVDHVAAAVGPGSVAAREALLGRFFRRATAAEADFVRRLLVGELRQGALAGLMADAVAAAASVPAPAVRRALMLSGDLCATATVALTGGVAGLGEVGLVVGRPVAPMLASGSPDVAAALADVGAGADADGAAAAASVEWKLDGARIQVHRDGDDVLIATRNLNDVTGRLPEVVDLARRLPARRVVLDGELIGAGADVDAPPQAFQDTMSRFGSHEAVVGALPLTPYFFDVLHADGEDLVDEPLSRRLEVLGEVAGGYRIPGLLTGDPAEAAAFAGSALAAGHEGVVVKGLSSRYEAGRRGGAWRKVKPVRTLDLVVLAAEWGHGRRRGWLSNLHLGARDPLAADRFVMVGKTFKGLTDELLAWQTAALLEREVNRDGIVVTVRPELVAEIALDGVQRSTRYPGGVALRFARVKRYRLDKASNEADTIDTVRALLNG